MVSPYAVQDTRCATMATTRKIETDSSGGVLSKPARTMKLLNVNLSTTALHLTMVELSTLIQKIICVSQFPENQRNGKTYMIIEPLQKGFSNERKTTSSYPSLERVLKKGISSMHS